MNTVYDPITICTVNVMQIGQPSFVYCELGGYPIVQEPLLCGHFASHRDHLDILKCVGECLIVNNFALPKIKSGCFGREAF